MKKHPKDLFVKYLIENPENFFSEKKIKRSVVIQICEEKNIPIPYWLISPANRTNERGFFHIPNWMLDMKNASKLEQKEEKLEMVKSRKSEKFDSVIPVQSENSFVPAINRNYVKFGYHDDLTQIIKSKIFYPVYIAGLSGNGKTFMVEQICASLGREMVRANITKKTDEDDLLGGMRIINGETVFHEGPVIKAMKRGAILLLDEVHLASMEIMCLQPVLEGKAVFLKKINEFVYPAPGFNVIATANTKGKFSEKGTFAGANIQDEAFLDRFAITLEQEYPSETIERKILRNAFEECGTESDEFLIEKLSKFASNARTMYESDSIDEVISTRRLVGIAKAIALFGDKQKAIEYCTNRFDQNVKDALRAYWDKIFVEPVPVEERESSQSDSLYSLNGTDVIVSSPTTEVNISF